MPPIVWDEGQNDFISQLTKGLTAAQPGVFQALNYKRGLDQDAQAKKAQEQHLLLLEQQLQRQQEQDAWHKQRLEASDVRAQGEYEHEQKVWTRDDLEQAAAARRDQKIAKFLQPQPAEEPPVSSGSPDDPSPWSDFDPAAMQAGVEQNVPPQAPQSKPFEPDIGGARRAIAGDLSGHAQMQNLDELQKLEDRKHSQAVAEYVIKGMLQPTAGGAEGEQGPPVLDPNMAKTLLTLAAVDPEKALTEALGLQRDIAKGKAQQTYKQFALSSMQQAQDMAMQKYLQAEQLGLGDEVLGTMRDGLLKGFVEQHLLEDAQYLQSDGVNTRLKEHRMALNPGLAPAERRDRAAAASAGKNAPKPMTDEKALELADKVWPGDKPPTVTELRALARKLQRSLNYSEVGGGEGSSGGGANPWEGFQGSQAQGQAPATNGKAPMPVQQKGALDGNATGQHLTREQILEYLKAHGVPVPE